MAHSENHLPAIDDGFAKSSRLMTISLEKTKVLVQAVTNTTWTQPTNTIEGFHLKCVDNFKYMCSTIFADGSHDKEITFRIQKASQAFERHGPFIVGVSSS